MKKVIIFLTFITMSHFAAAQGMQFFEAEKWADVLAKAKKENKLVFLDGYTAWCGPCKMLAARVFPTAEVGSFYNANFINAHFDMEKGDGVNVAQQYGINMYPTLLIIDGDGKIVERTAGVLQPAQLVEFGKRALGKGEKVDEWAAKYNGGDKSPETLRRYATALRKTGASSSKIANEYIGTQKDMSTPENLSIILNLVERVDSKLFDLLILYKDKLALLDQEFLKKQIKNAANITVQSAAEFKNKDLLAQAQTAMKKHVGGAEAKKFVITSNMQYFDKIGDQANYIKAAKKYGSSVIGSDAAELYQLAKTFNERMTTPETLKPAIAWAKKAAAMNPKYDQTVLHAALLLKTGDKKNANKIATQALDLAKKEGQNPYAAQQIIGASQEIAPKGK
jgi:thiol-disulfide isomerase/thioredoxin